MIVCGLNAVGLRTVEQLHLAGARVVVLDDAPDERLARVVRGWGIPHLPRGAHLSEPLFDAGIAGASAVVCAEATDLRTLETVLQIRDLRPDVRVVAELDNPAVAHAVEQAMGTVGMLDVAALFAPAVVEACVGHRARDILLGDTRFVATETIAPRDGTLRELYGSLAPIGMVTDAEDELIACPGRDQAVSAKDRVTLLGTHEDLDRAGLGPRQAHGGEGSEVGLALRTRDGAVRMARTVQSIADRPLRIALGLGLALLVISALVLHFGYRRAGGEPQLPLLDATYFTVETVATVGFGDFSFSAQPAWIEAFGIALIVAGTTLVTTLFALLTNALVQAADRAVARPGADPGHARARRAGGAGRGRHAGARGSARAGTRGRGGGADGEQQLPEQGPLDGGSGRARRRDARADARRDQPLERRRGGDPDLGRSDQHRDGPGRARPLGRALVCGACRPARVRSPTRQPLAQSFGFRHVWSTSAIAAPWFVGAALGLEVLFTFYVGNHPFLLARLRVSAGGGLDGLAMRELPATVRVVAIRRASSRWGARASAAQGHAAGARGRRLPGRPLRRAAGGAASRSRASGGGSGVARSQPVGIGAGTPARAAIARTSRSIVGQVRPWRAAARRIEPGIASSSGARPAAMSRCIELPSVS